MWTRLPVSPGISPVSWLPRSELDNPLAWYTEYIAEPDIYHPLLVAAWLHHRFAQIHPFPHGNGCVKRALVTWHLMQYDYLPIVVSRDERNDCITNVEHADDGDLIPLVNLTAARQRAMLQAISSFGNTQRSQRA